MPGWRSNVISGRRGRSRAASGIYLVGRGGPFFVGYLLQSCVPGSCAPQVRNMGSLDGDGEEVRGIPSEIPLKVHGEYSVT